ncbi:MAG: enoyl-CoA hydratase/isomerase family protein [Actinomycetota bacterium]
MEFQTLRFESEGEVGILTFNRPERANAVNSTMLEELNAFWREIQGRDDCRVLILTGEGEKGFCSGLDLKEAAASGGGFLSGELSGRRMWKGQREFSGLIKLMRACPQPVIAAVNGAAMGAGFSFAMAADLRLAVPEARFCASYINIGLGGADMGSSYLLWRLVGWGRAAELLLTGKVVVAEEAYRMGLVNEVCPREELMTKAREMAHMMLEKSPLGLRLTKDALNAALNCLSLDDALRLEDRNQVLLIEELLLAGGMIPSSPSGQRGSDDAGAGA